MEEVPAAWAKKAVNEAMAAGLISGGSYDFYRWLAVLQRGGMIIKRGDV